MSDTTIQIITYSIILLLILISMIYIYYIYKDNPAILNDFMNEIKNKITKSISETIDSYMTNHDISNIKLDELEKQLLDNIYDKVLVLIKEELIRHSEEYEKYNLMRIIKILDKAITRDNIMSFIKVIIDEDDSIQDKIMDLYNIAYKEEVINIEKDDKELEDFYKDKLIENIDNASDEVIEDEEEVKELDPNEVVDPFKDEVEEKINPPKEEDENIFDEEIDDEL